MSAIPNNETKLEALLNLNNAQQQPQPPQPDPQTQPQTQQYEPEQEYHYSVEDQAANSAAFQAEDQAIQQQPQTQPEAKPEESALAKELEGLSEEEQHTRLLQKVDDDLDLSLMQKKYDLKHFLSTRLVGPAPAEKFLVDSTYTMGAAHLLAADGGLGKGMLTLELAAHISGNSLLSTFCGRNILQHGKALIIAAEDTQDDHHRRIESLGLEVNDNLYLMELPNCSGGSSLFSPVKSGGYTCNPLWEVLRQQIIDLQFTFVVFDPLSALVDIDIDLDNVGAAFIGRHISALAQQSGACILICHHVNKNSSKERSGTRGDIRGVTGLVNAVRSASLLWEIKEKEAIDICEKIHISYEIEKIVSFRSVKGNFKRNRSADILLRNDNGQLISITEKLKDPNQYNETELENLLLSIISRRAEDLQPYQMTGKNGLFLRRSKMPEPLNTLSKRKLESIGESLLDKKLIVKCVKPGQTSYNWLDVPDGKVAKGEFEELKAGAENEIDLSHESGMPDWGEPFLSE